MNSYAFHISLYDLFFFGMIFVGLTFALLLSFVKSVNRSANRFLALALFTMILWMARILAVDVRLKTYLPHWDRLPMQFLLALGPLIYFYVLKITRPKYKFGLKDMLHLSPVLFEQVALTLEIKESIRTGEATYTTQAFQQLNPVLQLLIFISIMTYLYRSHKLIQNFYRRLQPVLMDRSLLEFRWLRRLLAATALLWCLWIVSAAADYFIYRNQSGIYVYYPFYIFFAVIIIWTAAAAFLRPQAVATLQMPAHLKQPVPAELRQKGIWIKKAIEANKYYEDPELSLSSLAEKLGLSPHELSRIINAALKKNFNDLINEYRVHDVAAKMQDPAYDRLTLLGMAFDAGFNSKATFIRAFKQLTGKTPAEYKHELEKEVSIYHLQPRSRRAAVISNHQAIHKWPEMKLNCNYMFRNYLKIAWRNLARHKANSLINILGLTIGMAASILIFFWVQNELGYDKFNKSASQIYRIICDAGGFDAAISPAGMAPGLKAGIPVIKNTVRLSQQTTVLFEVDNRKFLEKRAFFADSSFMDMFSYQLVEGERNTALKRTDGVLITQDMAKKYFGSRDPIGKVLRKDTYEDVVVTGVLANAPSNAHLQFDFIMPMASLAKTDNDVKDNVWDDLNYYSYLQLDKSFAATPSSLARLEQQINGIYHKNVPQTKFAFHLQPLTSIHLAPAVRVDLPGHGNAEYVKIFFVVAILVLLIACINFMNLATARSARRAKEIGLRKVSGALRGQLIIQFITESVLISFFALTFALTIVWFSLPGFNYLAGKALVIDFTDIRLWVTLLGIALITGIVSGSYPALFLSGFSPVNVLKGKVSSAGGNLWFRNTLVITQFVVSIVLLVGTVTIYSQLKFIRERNPGFAKDNLLYMQMTGGLGVHRGALETALKQNPLTGDYTVVSDLPVDLERGTLNVNWEGKDSRSQVLIPNIFVDENFLSAFKMQLLKGRGFSKSFTSDTNNYVINETMAFTMGLTPSTAVGKLLTLGESKGTVIGVVKDFNFKPIQQAIEPMVLRLNKYGGYVVVRAQPGRTVQTINALSKISNQLNPSFPFQYDFLDQDLANLYKGEQQVGSIFNLFAWLAVFISCLGLYGLSAFIAEQRTKEVGVRKVLGASVVNLVYLLSADITKLVLVAIVIAIPLSWYAAYEWLEGFAYHIRIGWLVFFLASLSALAIAWLTVAYESFKAAIVNPVESLRSE